MPTPRTLNELFFGAIERFHDRGTAMRARRNGTWVPITYGELKNRVRSLSLGLRELGVMPGERVGILAENRPEWAIADYACLTARCADVPVYPTLPAKQIAYILNDSGAVALFVSNQAQLAKVLEIRAELPALRYVIPFEGSPAGEGMVPFAQMEEKGAAVAASHPNWEREALEVVPDDLATVIYTSGTTGDPKGVMLTHRNITSNVLGSVAALPLEPGESCLSLLPLSHIFERQGGHYSMLQQGAVINYAESIDTAARDLLETRPTVMLAVPRLYEKIYARALETAVSGSPVKRKIFFWAKRVGEAWADRSLAHRPIPPGLAIQRALADRLVFSKIRARTGGRIKYFVSGGAPLSAEIARFFLAAGLPIFEGYGLTETSPTITVNRLGRTKLGTVGLPIDGVQVRIAPDGEIVTKGDSVMRGYYNKPEATAEAIDADGWFHTGDIGEIDADGFLKITDRKKDLIVTAGGKKIAPQPIEALLRQNPFISQAVILGDKRKFPIALIVPEFAKLETWAKANNISGSTHEELVRHPSVQELLTAEAKKHLRDLAQFEVPKRFLILDRDFTIVGGELTPKLSVKRRVVEKRYESAIEAIYAEAELHPEKSAHSS
ncbi:MAG: long-chain fatty acid--CoA ligase [Gemmatimonadota bacterium]